mgnify:FL=1|tara:strand:- start:185 stop:793 length:609 start_codon:yes stop_codon:yes gene_type:complete
MATIINADTSNGLKLTSDTSGQLELQSAGSTKVTMKTNGDIEFGNFTTDGGGTGVIFGVGGGSSAPEIQSSAIGTATRVHYEFYNNNGIVGKITTNGTATTFATSSDYRLKENNVSITNGIERVKLLKPYRFNFIADADKIVDGFYAHETQAVVPEAVVGEHNEVDKEGNPVHQAIDQSKLVPLLTAALQEAIQRIETLENA